MMYNFLIQQLEKQFIQMLDMHLCHVKYAYIELFLIWNLIDKHFSIICTIDIVKKL